MELHEIVKINESGMVANAVNFGMMADTDKNLVLSQGFVFNYNHNNPKSSTLGVLDAIQKSYQSQNQPNIHLFVQDYGKGKSHFALVAANYFQKLLDSSEVQGILEQIKFAAGNKQGIVEDLTAYKRRNSKHLVICISGEGIDLRQIFLKSLRQTLEDEGITDSLAQQLCQKPLEYLMSLEEEEINIVNNYLKENEYKFGDFKSIINLLEKDDYRVIPTIKKISKILNKGFSIDFETDLKIEEILEELINKLCSRQDAKYSGILILFDELNAYLQAWAKDPFNSGGLTLQNITNICETYKSKIALVCFTQIRPLKSVPSQSTDDYKKLASRLEIAESTYEPISSLELVIKGLLAKQFNTQLWDNFFKIWCNTLLADSRQSHENRINIYRQRGWSLEDFNHTITIGCFPLHPLNSYLLCNLDFTQGRTAIQYIKEDVKQFINSQTVEKNGKLNYLPAISLVDAFDNNFSQPEFSRHYSEYKKAYDTIAASATLEEIAVLKGLFLFYVSQSKLHKPASEKHDVILSELTGLSLQKIKDTLDKLSQEKQVIYPNLGDNTYRFYSGSNLLEIRQEIEEEASKQRDKVSVGLAVKECNTKKVTYLKSQNINAINFIATNQLLNDEWFFEYQFYSIAEFKQVLSGYQTIDNIEGKGIFAYILVETLEELQDIRHNICQLISESKHKYSIAVAVPNQPVKDICYDLLQIDIIRNKATDEKQEVGKAFQQLSKQLQDKITREMKEVIFSCTYHCFEIDKLSNTEKYNQESIVSHLLQQLYRFVPPLAKCDKIALNKTTGTKVIGYVAKRLLEDELNPNQFPDESYRTLVTQVFTTAWGLFKTTSQKYSVQIPTNKNVREAWDIIDSLTSLRDKKRFSITIEEIWQELSKPPFGYNEYTFTMLFAAWISYHRSEVILKGSFGIPKNQKEQVLIQEKPIKDWVITNVFDKPKDFVNVWILTSGKKPQLIRSQPVICPEIPTGVDYNQAKKLVEEIEQFINSADPGKAKVDEIKPKKQQLSAQINKIDNLLKLVEEVENLPNDVKFETLISLYPKLQQIQPELSKPKTINLVSPNMGASFKSDDIVVHTTKQQKQRQIDALKIVHEKINKFVEKLGEQSESLKTEQEFGRYQVELQTAIEKMSEVFLPQHLIDTLNYSLQVATRKLNEIQHQSEIKDCLDKIESRYNSLSNNATQQDYVDAIKYIDTLINNIPVVQENSHYQQIINQIQAKCKNLEQKITLWEERLTDITKNQALELYQEVSQQQNRFTQTEFFQKVKQILEQLNIIILEINDQDEINIKKQEQDDQTMQQLRQHNSNSFKSCQEGIEQIYQLKNQLNFPERFRTEIEQLINLLNVQVSSYREKIDELTAKLTEVKSHQELNQIHTNLVKLELFFKDSNQYLTCQQLHQEIDALRELLQITQLSESNTIEIYQNQLQRLNYWYNGLKNCTPNLQTKYDNNKFKLDQEIERIENKYQADAQSWLDNLQTELTKIEEELEDEKLKLIDKLLQKINNSQIVHINYLNNSDNELLEKIKIRCIDIQNESLENQIITLFRQLTPNRKQNLYSKLQQDLYYQEEINE